MKLNENLNRIKSIMGVITEASKKDILINKFGLSPELSETLYELCGPLTIWMFNKLIEYQNYIFRSYGDKELTKDDIIQRFNKHADIITRTWNPWIVSVMDYIRVGLNGNISEIKDKEFHELRTLAQNWHNSLEVGGGKINYKEENPIVIDFGDGYYWADLETNDSREECDRMGHCGRTNSRNTIFSLRQNKKLPGDKYSINKSVLTAAIDTNNGVLYQLKGPKNSKPSKEYFKYIIPLFSLKDEETGNYLIKEIGREYGHENDFKISDLTENEIIKFIEYRPDLFSEENMTTIDEIITKYPNLLEIFYNFNPELFNPEHESMIYDDIEEYHEIIKVMYENNPEWFNTKKQQYKLYNMGIIENDPIQWVTEITIPPIDVDDYLDGGWSVGTAKNKWGGTRDISIFEAILEGNTMELYQSYDVDWKSSIDYYINDENTKFILKKLKELNPDTEFDEEMDLTELIEEYDEDDNIKNAIRDATEQAESDSYVQELEKELKYSLEKYGDVLYIGDEGVKLKINLRRMYYDMYDKQLFWDYLDNCEDKLDCVFTEMIKEGDVDKENFSIDSRWYPDVDLNNFNELLYYRLNEI